MPLAANNAVAALTTPLMLQYADYALLAAGWLILAAAIARWLRNGTADPLQHAPARPNRLLAEHVLGVVLFFYLATVASAMIDERLTDRPTSLLTGSIVQALGALACIIAGTTFHGGAGRFLLGRASPGRSAALAVICLPVALALAGAIYPLTVWLIALFDPGFQPADHAVIEAFRGGSQPAWALWVGAVMVAPLAEELFFRGLLQTSLQNVLRGRWPAIGAAALAFGLIHSFQPQVVPTMVALGLLLGYLYEATGSLVAPVLLHALFNLKTFVWETLLASSHALG